jgi:DNA polymerase-3 subunit epsilon
VVDTAALARRVFLDDEVPNHKLGTLATYLRTRHRPTHRALADARATVDLLHALIGRLGSHQVFDLDAMVAFASAITPAQRRKRYLAEGLPDAPGVYIFRDGQGRPLYIGKSGSISTRVRSYFTASETRKRISEMIHIAERVEALVCAHSLEAEVLELRLIAAHQPPYNRRSKHQDRAVWLKLTTDAYPRLSMVARVRDDTATYLGPFPSRRLAQLAADAVYDALPLRRCTRSLSPRQATSTCALADLGRCAAPCDLRVSPSEYGQRASRPFVEVVTGDPGIVVRRLLARIDRLSTAHRFEDAARVRGRLAALLRAVLRTQRLTALTSLDEVVAARPDTAGGWELAIVRHGRLVAAGRSSPATHPRTTLAGLLANAEAVPRRPGPTPCASAEETERILAWLERPEVRLVECPQGWAYPTSSAARYAELLTFVESARNPAAQTVD